VVLVCFDSGPVACEHLPGDQRDLPASCGGVGSVLGKAVGLLGGMAVPAGAQNSRFSLWCLWLLEVFR